MASGSSIIIINKDKKILLQLRDNIPDIPFPNCWSTFGGHLNKGETPLVCAIREAKEEFDYELEEAEYIGNLLYLGKHDSYIFVKYDPEIDIGKIKLIEGKKAKFFSEKEIKKISNWAYNTKEIVEFCFKHIRGRYQ